MPKTEEEKKINAKNAGPPLKICSPGGRKMIFFNQNAQKKKWVYDTVNQ